MDDEAVLGGKGRKFGKDGAAEQSGSTPIELVGAIKWFDVSKGYGFVIPDDPSIGDVLLHATCLRQDGHATAHEGARVVCLARRGERGFQVLKILSMDSSTAIRPHDGDGGRAMAVVAESGLERAIVKWFNRSKGFGFLTRGEGTADIFVHMETLRRFGVAELRPGQVVLVRYGRGNKGLMAAEIHPDIGSPPITH